MNDTELLQYSVMYKIKSVFVIKLNTIKYYNLIIYKGCN